MGKSDESAYVWYLLNGFFYCLSQLCVRLRRNFRVDASRARRLRRIERANLAFSDNLIVYCAFSRRKNKNKRRIFHSNARMKIIFFNEGIRIDGFFTILFYVRFDLLVK